MNFNALWEEYRRRLVDIRPFLRTKTGSKLGVLFALDFIILFFAPLMHGFVGTAIFGCVASVFLILIWRRYDRSHAVVPAVLLCIPMLIDMPIYHDTAVIVGFITAMVAMILISFSSLFSFFDRINDGFYTYITAGVICVMTVVIACILLFILKIAWWIFCIIAFLIVAGVFMGVVFSTAAYTASDGRRQARKRRLQQQQEERYRDYQPPARDNHIYNLDDDDFTDVE